MPSSQCDVLRAEEEYIGNAWCSMRKSMEPWFGRG